MMPWTVDVMVILLRRRLERDLTIGMTMEHALVDVLSLEAYDLARWTCLWFRLPFAPKFKFKSHCSITHVCVGTSIHMEMLLSKCRNCKIWNMLSRQEITDEKEISSTPILSDAFDRKTRGAISAKL
jgi:hypothetical protein